MTTTQTEIVTYLDRPAQEACATSDEGYVRVPFAKGTTLHQACLYAARTLAHRRGYGEVDPVPLVRPVTAGLIFVATREDS